MGIASARRLIALCLLGALGCDASVERDAGAPIVLPDGGQVSVAPPAPPAVVGWDCPEGWSEVRVGDATACEPWPASFEGCPDGEARFVGDAACATFAPCPDGGWPDDLPADGVVYVRAGEVGGDGTRDRPFGRAADGLAAAAPGDTVALAPGTYEEALTIEAPLTLRGACPARTVLRAVGPGIGGNIVLAVRARDVTIEDLSITGDRWGIDVRAEGSAVVRRTLIHDARVFGVAAAGGSSVTLEETIVRRVDPGESGAGVACAEGSRIELRRSILEDNIRFSMLSFAEGTEVLLRDTVVRRTHADSNGQFGIGVAIGMSARLDAERLIVERSRVTGVIGTGPTAMRLRDVVVRGTRPSAVDGMNGVGLAQTGGGEIDMERAYLRENVVAGITVTSPTTRVAIRDAVVADTRASPIGERSASAIGVALYAALELSRVHLEANAGTGITVDSGGRLDVRDLSVRRTWPGVFEVGGRGLNFTRGAIVDAERVGISGGVEAGILLQGEATEVTMRDVVVERTDGRRSDGRTGRGLTVIGGALGTFERMVLRDNREASLLVLGEGSVARLSDLLVEDTLQQACQPTTCAETGGGTGVAVVDGGHADLTRFVIRRSALAGLQLANGATIRVSEGLVADNLIGVNVQDVDFDLSILTRGVIYRGNGVNLDSTALPIPRPAF